MMVYAAGMAANLRDVVAERDLEASTAPGDTIAVRVAFDRRTGSEALEQRVLRCSPGRSAARGPEAREEALFVLDGRGTILIDGVAHRLEPDTAVLVAPGARYSVDAPAASGLELLSVLVPPAPGRADVAGAPLGLAEQEARDATSDREFRVLLDPRSGLSGATQFVGYIPTKRAPEHHHRYDEVIHVLDGEGVLHIGSEHTPIGRGSCIHLRPGLNHCLENTGAAEMRVLGVFRPAGDPSEAYLPDGTRAYVSKEDG
jgi:mannose-6-phosphate isomerase-like protein (cupin superfamily)